MVLTSVASVARRAGIGIRVVDELLGTGDSANKSFDLDNDYIIASSYTLNYGAASGNDVNSFTALTETTHYTLDRESGKVLLTTAGVTALGSNKLYATYDYLAKLNEDDINAFITKAEARLNALTGKYWEDTSIVEYHDGNERSSFPRTNRPFQQDRRVYDSITLNAQPAKSLSSVYFLYREQNTFDKVFSDDGGSFTDNTSEAETPSGTSFNVFAATPAVNDAVYFGLPYKFLGLKSVLETLGTDAGSLAVTWEYYDGSSWSSLSSVSSDVTNADSFQASGLISWALPSGWSKTSVNSSNEFYYVRARLSAGSYTAVPKMWESYPDPNNVLAKEISLRGVDLRDNKLVFIDQPLISGVSNVRVSFTAGMSSSHPHYQLGLDLADAIASLMTAVAITGGSFDDETSFQLGAKAVTIGEVYVNVAEVVKQLTNEIEELKKSIGRRFLVARSRNFLKG